MPPPQQSGVAPSQAASPGSAVQSQTPPLQRSALVMSQASRQPPQFVKESA